MMGRGTTQILCKGIDIFLCFVKRNYKLFEAVCNVMYIYLPNEKNYSLIKYVKKYF